MKTITIMSAFIAITMVFVNVGCAKSNTPTTSTCNGTNEQPCLVQDIISNNTDAVENYRDSSMMSASYHGNTVGLEQLAASGSAAPSQRDLITITQYISSASNHRINKIIDLDLREENHGYLNNEAITLATENDWINLGKTHEQAMTDEEHWLQSLAQSSIAQDVLTPEQFKKGEFNQGLDVPVKSIESEQQAAEALGYQYERLTVTDHMAPNSAETDRFVSIIDQLPANAWVHMHCRGGKGRTTTFLAMYDMLKNADKVSFDDIIARQASVTPFYDLTNVDNKNPELQQYYRERLNFLHQFYQFAKDRKNGYAGSWSDWIAKNTSVNSTSLRTDE